MKTVKPFYENFTKLNPGGFVARQGLISYPHRKLLQVVGPVAATDIASPTFRDQIQKMRSVMPQLNAVSCCAPKMDWPARVVFVGSIAGNTTPEVFVNPKVEWRSEELCGMWENCMSMDNVGAWVKRPKEIFVTSLDETGAERREQMSGMRCRLFLHEYAHLDGLNLIDEAEGRDFLITSNAIAQRENSWPVDFPSRAAYLTPQFMLYDYTLEKVQRVPEFEMFYNAFDAAAAERKRPLMH